MRTQMTLIEAQWNVLDAPVGDGSKILVFGDDGNIDILIPVGPEVAQRIAAKLTSKIAVPSLVPANVHDLRDLQNGGDGNGSGRG